jgi:DNA-binding NarL/FixJ family response regulator
MKRITVLLAEDHTVVREGFRTLLNSEEDIEIVGEAQTGREAVKLVRKLRPAVVVMDIAMPLLNGLEATRQIAKEVPATHVLILSAHSDSAYIERAIQFGAKGFMLKQSSARALAQGIREVQKGKTFFAPSIARRIKTNSLKNSIASVNHRSAQLTSREVETLQLIAEGNANKQTAGELEISVKTVEKHRQHLMEKLDIHDTAGLTRYAIAEGIIESSVQLTIL